MYYIRKLSKLTTITKLQSLPIEDIPADLLKQEWATTGNTLSFWKCDSLDDKENTLKAILLSTTKIEKSKFIVLNDDALEKYGIERDFSEKGRTAYLGFEDLHVNFCKLTYKKIGDIIGLTKVAVKDASGVIELSKDNVKGYIKDVCDSGQLNEANIQESLMEDIKKYGLYIA